MEQQEILERAIAMAIDGGWKWPFPNEYIIESRISLEVGNTPDYKSDFKLPYLWNGGAYDDYELLSSRDIIFNHDFAKALWGETQAIIRERNYSHMSFWQYHLQEMVIADDPIKYLGESLPEAGDEART